MEIKFLLYLRIVKIFYSCYALKKSSKVNLSVYFLPAVGWEKVIKIRRFSSETAIKQWYFCLPPAGGGKSGGTMPCFLIKKSKLSQLFPCWLAGKEYANKYVFSSETAIKL
jgi:hypothetical protein